MLNRIICIGLLCLQNGSVCMATDTGTLAGMPTGAMAGTRRTADDTVYATPQQRIDIGGRSLNLVCIGHGSPTVVFDSGMGDWSVSWALVQPRIGKRTRACGYDRAGLGFSDPSPRPSNSANMVDDLHRLLRAGGIAPPYLLVGHSLGGLNLQLFADRHLPEVAGMVLVDASHPQTIARVDAATNGAQTRHWKAQVRHAADCVRWPTVGMQSTQFRAACIEPDDPRLTAAQNATRVAIARTRSYQQAQLSEASNYLNGSSFARRSSTPGRNGCICNRIWRSCHSLASSARCPALDMTSSVTHRMRSPRRSKHCWMHCRISDVATANLRHEPFPGLAAESSPAMAAPGKLQPIGFLNHCAQDRQMVPVL